MAEPWIHDTCTHTLSLSLCLSRSLSPSLSLSFTHTHKHTHTRKQHTHTHTHRRTHTHRHTHTHAHSNTHTHTHVYTHTHICTYMLFYFHTYIYIMQSEPLRHTATHCNTLQHTATHCNTYMMQAEPLIIERGRSVGMCLNDTSIVFHPDSSRLNTFWEGSLARKCREVSICVLLDVPTCVCVSDRLSPCVLSISLSLSLGMVPKQNLDPILRVRVVECLCIPNALPHK